MRVIYLILTTEELIEKLELIQKLKCETNTLEINSAEKGCSKYSVGHREPE